MKSIKRHNKKVNHKDLMTSRCCIAILNQSYEYESVFCADGHPEATGRTLTEYYNSPSKIEKLISMGDLFSLTVHPETCGFYDNSLGFNRTFKHLNEMIEYYRECGCNYAYVFNCKDPIHYSAFEYEWDTYSIQSDVYSLVNLKLAA